MKNKAYSKKAHKDFGPDEEERMRERRLKTLETYLGKRALLEEWEMQGVNDAYVQSLRTKVYRLHTYAVNMGADIE